MLGIVPPRQEENHRSASAKVSASSYQNGSSARVQYCMATAGSAPGLVCSIEVTNPESSPCAHCRWLEIQFWLGTCARCTVEAAWCSRTGTPAALGLVAAGRPPVSSNPSPLPSMPR